jgi:hypothetical protein
MSIKDQLFRKYPSDEIINKVLSTFMISDIDDQKTFSRVDMKYINKTYSIEKLLDCVKTRYNRSSFERVIACLMQLHVRNEPLFGNIHKYCPWELRVDQIDDYSHLPIIKVWTGR